MVAHEPRVSHQYRRDRLAATLPADLDVLLLTSPENIRYLCGFTGSNGALLIGRAGDAVLATDGRYLIQAAEQAPDVTLVEARSVAAGLVERAAEGGARRIGFEPHAVTVAGHDALRSAASSAEVVASPRLVESLRSIKDAGEIEALTTACQITDAAFNEVVLTARVGVTERELAFALTTTMRRHGAEADSFDSIVAFGPNSAVPHHEPTDRALAAGDLLKTDFGAQYAGYHADMTRTVVVGPAAQWQREIHAVVHEVQSAGRAAAAVGAKPADLDADARAAIEATGHPVSHGLGHGVGLQIHEDPFLTPSSSAGPLAADMVITIEPGLYVEGRGGVRIEDTVAVVADGEPRLLTTSSRELIEI